MKPQGGRELEARQDEDLIPQATIFLKALLLLGTQAVQAFQEHQFLDLFGHRSTAGHGVVVGDGNDIQPLFPRLAQDVQIGHVWLRVAGRGWSVDVEVNTPPLQLFSFFHYYPFFYLAKGGKGKTSPLPPALRVVRIICQLLMSLNLLYHICPFEATRG